MTHEKSCFIFSFLSNFFICLLSPSIFRLSSFFYLSPSPSFSNTHISSYFSITPFLISIIHPLQPHSNIKDHLAIIILRTCTRKFYPVHSLVKLFFAKRRSREKHSSTQRDSNQLSLDNSHVAALVPLLPSSPTS